MHRHHACVLNVQESFGAGFIAHIGFRFTDRQKHLSSSVLTMLDNTFLHFIT